MRKLLILLFIVLVASLAGEMNQLRIEGRATTPKGVFIAKDLVDKNLEQAALIIFLSDIDTDLAFRPSNGLVRKVDKSTPGRYEVYVSPSEKRIRVNAMGYTEFEVVLSSYNITNLESGEVYQHNLTGDAKAVEIPVIITCPVNGAEVYLDGTLQGIIEDRMLLLKHVGQGKHRIRVSLDGYKPFEINERITLDNNSFKVDLLFIQKEIVTIKSIPVGAEVYINGEHQQNKQTDTEISLFPGTYNVTLKKVGFNDLESVIDVFEGDKNIYSFNFTEHEFYNRGEESYFDTIYDLDKKGFVMQVSSLIGAYNRWTGKKGHYTFANLLLTPDGLGYQIPMIAKVSFMVPRKSAQTLRAYYGGLSVLGDIVLGEDSLILDIVSLNFGYMIASKDFKRRVMIDSEFLGKVAFNTVDAFKVNGKEVKLYDNVRIEDGELKKDGVSPVAWVPAHIALKYEHMIKGSFCLSGGLGAYLQISSETGDWYEKDVIENWNNADVLPEAFDEDPDISVYKTIIPYISVGVRF